MRDVSVQVEPSQHLNTRTPEPLIGWALPLLLVGVIGQVGMLNSFCHLHTPIRVTLLRTWNGLWLGALLGLILAAVWLVLRKGRSQKAEG